MHTLARVKANTKATVSLERENQALRQQVAKLEKDLSALQSKLQLLLKRRFGPSSEQLHPGQLELFDAAAATASSEAKPAEEESITYRRKKVRPGHGRAGFPEDLPRNDIAIDPPEHERVCSCCSKALVRIRSEVTERGDVKPVQIVINRYTRGVWACADGCSAPKTAELPSSVVAKAKWEPSAYAHVAITKYADHQPLHRQAEIFLRNGVGLPKSTLCDMALATGYAVRFIADRVRIELLTAPVLLADETPIQFAIEMEAGRRKKRKFKTGYLWVYRTPDGDRVAFCFTTSRSRAGPIAFLGDWRGTLLTDEYSGYDEACRTNRIVRAFCWAHARRRVMDARDSRPEEAAEALRLINALFRIEAAIDARLERIKGRAELAGLPSMSGDDAARVRLAARQRWSSKVVDELREKLVAWRDDRSIVPKSLFGVAVRYLLPEAPRHATWNAFTVFLENGHVPLHNNGAENSIRPSVIGRKNWLFAGSVSGGDTAAIMYSLLLTCRALGVNPEEYLTDVLSRLDRDTPEQLTPWAWKREREARHARATEAGSPNPTA